MKITTQGREPQFTLGAITLGSGTGGSGQVLTSAGSNGSVSWASNVALVTANTSNALLGPSVNIASGTGVSFAVSSNTLTINASGTSTDYVTVTDGGGEVLSTVAASGSTETIDLADGNVHDITLTASCTFTFTGAAAGRARSFTLFLRQDGTGGRTTTWPASVIWPGGTPTLDTTASSVSVLVFATLDGGANWYGFQAGGASSVSALDDLSDVAITSALTGQRLRYSGTGWVNSSSFPEQLVQDGSSAPPVTLTNEAQDDWLYGDP